MLWDLADGGDTDALLGEGVSEFGEDAGAVGDGEAEVGGEADFGERLEGGGVVGGALGAGWLAGGGYYVEEVGEDGTGGCAGASAGAFEDDGAERFGFDGDGIEDAVDAGHGVVRRDQGGVDAEVEAVRGAAGGGEHADGVAEVGGVPEVAGAEGADALAVDLVGLDAAVEGEGGEDGELVGGVNAFDVVGGVGFGVAEALGLLEGFCVGCAALGHFGDHVVGSAVDDGAEAADIVGLKFALEDADDGDAAADAGFVAEFDAVSAGKVEESWAVLGHDLFVGGDDGFAGAEGAGDAIGGGGFAADQLDHDVDVIALAEGERVIKEVGVGDDAVATRCGVADGDGSNGEVAPGATGEGGSVAAEFVEDAPAHDAEAEQADADIGVVGHAGSWVGGGAAGCSAGAGCVATVGAGASAGGAAGAASATGAGVGGGAAAAGSVGGAAGAVAGGGGAGVGAGSGAAATGVSGVAAGAVGEGAAAAGAVTGVSAGGARGCSAGAS